MTNEETKGIPLHTKILIGFLAGAGAGVTVNQLTAAGTIRYSTLEWFVENVTAPDRPDLSQSTLHGGHSDRILFVVAGRSTVGQCGKAQSAGRQNVRLFPCDHNDIGSHRGDNGEYIAAG